jgi:hypothetical protein
MTKLPLQKRANQSSPRTRSRARTLTWESMKTRRCRLAPPAPPAPCPFVPSSCSLLPSILHHTLLSLCSLLSYPPCPMPSGHSCCSSGTMPHSFREQCPILDPAIHSQATVNDFMMLKVIGKGSFGKVLHAPLPISCQVFVARHKVSQKLFAVKVLNKLEIIRLVSFSSNNSLLIVL